MEVTFLTVNQKSRERYLVSEPWVPRKDGILLGTSPLVGRGKLYVGDLGKGRRGYRVDSTILLSAVCRDSVHASVSEQ